MTDDQMKAINDQFETINEQFGTLNRRFDAQRITLEHVDAEVHRQGVLREADSHELKIAIEQVGAVQHVMNAKLDVVRGSIEQRLVPLEVAVRSHTNTLADHAGRLDRLEEDR